MEKGGNILIYPYQMPCIIWLVSIPLKAPLYQFQNITLLTGGSQRIFLIVMCLDWRRQEKDLTQFQHLIVIVTTKIEKDQKR